MSGWRPWTSRLVTVYNLSWRWDNACRTLRKWLVSVRSNYKGHHHTVLNAFQRFHLSAVSKKSCLLCSTCSLPVAWRLWPQQRPQEQAGAQQAPDPLTPVAKLLGVTLIHQEPSHTSPGSPARTPACTDGESGLRISPGQTSGCCECKHLIGDGTSILQQWPWPSYHSQLSRCCEWNLVNVPTTSLLESYRYGTITDINRTY